MSNLIAVGGYGRINYIAINGYHEITVVDIIHGPYDLQLPIIEQFNLTIPTDVS